MPSLFFNVHFLFVKINNYFLYLQKIITFQIMLQLLFSDNYIIKKDIKNIEDFNFFDSVINFLALDRFKSKSLKDIVDKCDYPKQYFQQFTLMDEIFNDDEKYKNFIFESALNKLIKDSIVRLSEGKYSLDYHGLMIYSSGGILKNQIKTERKATYQNLIWNITLYAFVINLLFQLYNTFCTKD